MKAPTTAKQCKSFVGMVNFVSIFCPELQRLLKPIYDLTRKGRQFVWGEEQQDAFEEIKRRLQKPPVSHMPDKVGRFQIYICNRRCIVSNTEWKAKIDSIFK